MSGISWTDATFNPWIGCTKVSPACEHCYAERDNGRYSWVKGWGPGVPRKRTTVATWRNPVIWNAKAEQTGKPLRVFCASLADIFDNEVPDEWRADLWRLIACTPNLRWILLTKRIGNAGKMLPSDWPYPNAGMMATIENQAVFDRDWRKLAETPAAWRGISCEPLLGRIDISSWTNYYPVHEDQTEKTKQPGQFDAGDLFGTIVARGSCHQNDSLGPSERVGKFDDETIRSESRGDPTSPESWREIGGDSSGFQNQLSSGFKNSAWGKVGCLSWVITGGESGPVRRPLDMDAVRFMRDQCARNGITFHHKQNGGLRGKDNGCLIDGGGTQVFSARSQKIE